MKLFQNVAYIVKKLTRITELSNVLLNEIH